MNDLSKYVPNVFFEQIPINNLVSSQEYQRNLSIKHVQKAAANFDLYQINPVKVSRRDNINYVFNGQHTIEIVALVSGSRETPVWCMVYDDLEYQHEADIFANQMKYVKPLLPYEIFMASIEAGRFLRSTWLALYLERTRLFHFWYIQNNAPDTEQESPVHIFADIPSSPQYCRFRFLPVQRPPEW